MTHPDKIRELRNLIAHEYAAKKMTQICEAVLMLSPELDKIAKNQVNNVAVGERTSLNTLFGLLRDNLQTHGVAKDVQPVYRDFRAGDVRHSQADTEKARRLLGYAHSHRLADGIAEAMPWYADAALTTTTARFLKTN